LAGTAGRYLEFALLLKLFGVDVDSPQDLRKIYIKMRKIGLVSSDLYPEQFDVSFDFSPRMCDRGNEDLWPFRKGSIAKYCLGRDNKSDRYCLVTMILCGYQFKYQPVKCQIENDDLENLWAGCHVQIATG